jgi:hypothetical protein
MAWQRASSYEASLVLLNVQHDSSGADVSYMKKIVILITQDSWSQPQRPLLPAPSFDLPY